MKLPKNHLSVSIDLSPYKYPHLPLGFHSFSECALGNGDEFGLYWPIGKEDLEPIVCETFHDGGTISPVFSNFDTFLKHAKSNNFEWFDASSSEFQDQKSPLKLLHQAKSKQSPDTFLETLKTLDYISEIFPEYGDSNCLRARAYFRAKQPQKALNAALSAIISPPCFGTVNAKTLYLFKSQTQAPRIILNNPIYNQRKKLNWVFGGKKLNDTYTFLLDAITYYEDINDYHSATSLAQAYVQYMTSETGAFQERYGFDLSNFIERQIKISSKLPHTTRELHSHQGNNVD